MVGGGRGWGWCTLYGWFSIVYSAQGQHHERSGEKYKVDPLHAYKLLHFEVLNFTGYINHTNQN